MTDKMIEQMSDETLLDQINAFDPYDVEFARRFRVQKARIKELEAESARLRDTLVECENEIDAYIWQEYPSDHPVHKRYRKRDFSANPARVTLAYTKEGK